MSRLVNKIIFMVCLIVFVGSAAYVLQYVVGTSHASNELKDLKAANEDEPVDLWALYEKSSDFRGWIEIDGTKIDYPVMQSDVKEPEFYLHRDFNGDYSYSGTPFLDSTSIDTSANWLIYGHNMQIGTMFHDLLEFDDEEFWEQHQTFSFDRLLCTDKEWNPENAIEDRANYEIVAACYSQIRPETSKAFKYYEYTCIEDEETFNEYVDGIMSEACYDTGAELEYGDQLVTLSTCAYHVDDGRFYIVGRKLKY